MLASLAALHLLLAAPPPAPPAQPAPAEPAPAPAELAPPPAEPAPAPAELAPPTATKPAPAPLATPRPFLSLLGAEPLQGGSAAVAWAGWSSFGVTYAIGFSPRDDLGVFLDHDWARSELRVGALYRRPLSRGGVWDLGLRAGLSWYENFGTTYVFSENHSDRGLELSPALVGSRRTGGGIFAASLEAPMTVTWKVDTGFLFRPRLSVSYEAPLYPQLTAGARAGVGYRAGSGDAPLAEGRGEVQFLVFVGYQLL